MITNGFRKAELLRDEEKSTNSPRDESDIESDNEREIVKVSTKSF